MQGVAWTNKENFQNPLEKIIEKTLWNFIKSKFNCLGGYNVLK